MKNKQIDCDKFIKMDCDMLEGNINRMMVTHDKKELREMYDWACKRLSRIYSERYEILDRGEQE